jgi:UPF0755 protein
VKRVLLKVVTGLIVLTLAAAGAGAYVMWTRMHQPFQAFEGERFVEIPQGSGSRAIARRLVEAGVVPDAWTFRAAVRVSGRGQGLQAGEYRFANAASPLAVVERLAQGDVYTVAITFPEGLTIDEMADIFASRGLGTAQSFRDAARDVSAIADLDPAARDLEGYLFPETYPVSRQVDAAALVAVMVERFKMIFAELEGSGAPPDLTTRQIVTLASLVEKETARAEERPVVSAVYRNRLAIGMGMQADPTVIYALRKRGKYDGNIRRVDLGIDSPYNTYRYRGLPPGPIAAPGRAALEAALTPAGAKYLYFVSRNDGSHVFAETLQQHNANVQKFQIEYFRAGRPGRSGRSGGSGRGSGK